MKKTPNHKSKSDALVFFGATGDLAFKKIFPALLAMVKDYAEEAWRIVNAALKADTPLHEYKPKTWGPKEAEQVAPPGGLHNPDGNSTKKTSSWIFCPRRKTTITPTALDDTVVDNIVGPGSGHVHPGWSIDGLPGLDPVGLSEV